MPFQEWTKMELRSWMVRQVVSGELSISDAARQYGVSRNTVKLWLARANHSLDTALSERSRRPHTSPRQTDPAIVAKLLALKVERPVWGAKKLVAKLWPDSPPISVRTADRILERHGLVQSRQEVLPLQRFERETPNELWQMDFKGLGRNNPGYSPLTVLDDCTRYCLAFEPLKSHGAVQIFKVLWELFGQYGLPEAILSDNEPCFAEISRIGPSWLEARLWLLGIRTLHGRAFHPQTQGKVERFHGTAQREVGRALWQPDIAKAKQVLDHFVQDYNYERPHESLDMQVPGSVYQSSARRRPARMPQHQLSEGAIARSVDSSGRFSFEGTIYRAGRGLVGQQVELREDDAGFAVYFAQRAFMRIDPAPK